MDDAYLSDVTEDIGKEYRLFNIHYFKENPIFNEDYRLKMRRNEKLELSEDRNVWLKNNIGYRNNKNNYGNRFRKPSLQSRLQNGGNLQLCFVNEHSSEMDDTNNENGIYSLPVISQSQYLQQKLNSNTLPTEKDEIMSLSPDLIHHTNLTSSVHSISNKDDNNNNNVSNRSSTTCYNDNLQNSKWSADIRDEVRTTLKKLYNDSYRKMELERFHRPASPITCTIRTSLKKVGVESKEGYRGRIRMNRHMLTKMNTNQLQSIADDLLTFVEYLNEQLVEMLMERDELHMSRDSLLVDIEDLTAHLEAKRVYTKDTRKLENINRNISNDNNTGIKNITSGMRLIRLSSYIKN
ncbi:schwannomin-interacting protein 1-like isoform X2 [Planococcus citri]|uniref:schwannomin-interacting protein 1-like isoform X2 n=1 Tax=Planococcus citri TaxID=170843 RepID=UPI0031F9295E